MKDESKTIDALKQKIIGLETQLAEHKIHETLEQWVVGRMKFERRQLEAILNSLPMGVDIVNDRHEILFQNRWMKDRFGNKRGAICYKSYRGQDRPCQDCPVIKAIKNNKTEYGKATTRDGKEYELTASPIGYVDNEVAAVEIVMDVTGVRRTEKALLQSQKIYTDLVNSLLRCLSNYP